MERLAIQQAWLTASLSKRKKLPPLSRLLPSRSRRLTEQDKAWAARIRAAEGHREIPVSTDV